MTRRKANGGVSRGRPRDPEIDAAIMQSALDLLIERGFDETSIEQIAKRAGVARLTVYRRWEGKEEIFVDAIDSLRPPVASSPDLISAVSMSDLLDAFAETVARKDMRSLLVRLIGSAQDRPELLAAYWRRHIQVRRDAMKVVLERARDNGDLSSDLDLDVVEDMIAGALFYRMLTPGADVTAAGIRGYLSDVVRQLGYSSA